jgi:recombination protein RecA
MSPKKKSDAPVNPIATATKALILKATGQKAMEPTFSTLPHVDSGSLIINGLIGGSLARDGKGLTCPGYPRRKVTEIFGPESSGKTTVALSAAVQVQKAGGTVMFLDFEHAIHHGYAQSIGVKYDDTFMVFAPDTMEEGLKMIYVGIHTGVDLIIVDSVAAMVPQDELDKKLDETAKVGAVAKKMAESLPKICGWLATCPKTGTGEAKKTDLTKLGTALILLNQERATISTGGHGPDTNTAGGKAVKFYASLRLRFVRTGSEIIEKKDPMTGKTKKFPYGNKTQVKVVKNKLDGTQGSNGDFFIRYGFGLDNYFSIIETGIAQGIVKKEGAYYAYGEHRAQGRDKFRSLLMANSKLYTEVCTKVTAALGAAATAVKDEDITEEDELMADMGNEFGESSSDTEEVVDDAEAG